MDSIWSLTRKKYIDELLSNNSDVNLSKEDLDFKITYYEERGKDKCKFQVCNGHDMTEVIRLLLEQKDLLNSPIHGNISKGRIEGYLRMGFTLEEFKKTELYKDFIFPYFSWLPFPSNLTICFPNINICCI